FPFHFSQCSRETRKCNRRRRVILCHNLATNLPQTMTALLKGTLQMVCRRLTDNTCLCNARMLFVGTLPTNTRSLVQMQCVSLVTRHCDTRLLRLLRMLLSKVYAPHNVKLLSGSPLTGRTRE